MVSSMLRTRIVRDTVLVTGWRKPETHNNTGVSVKLRKQGGWKAEKNFLLFITKLIFYLLVFTRIIIADGRKGSISAISFKPRDLFGEGFEFGEGRLWKTTEQIPAPFSRCPTMAKLKFVLKLRPMEWSNCLKCHSSGSRVSFIIFSRLWKSIFKTIIKESLIHLCEI